MEEKFASQIVLSLLESIEANSNIVNPFNDDLESTLKLLQWLGVYSTELEEQQALRLCEEIISELNKFLLSAFEEGFDEEKFKRKGSALQFLGEEEVAFFYKTLLEYEWKFRIAFTKRLTASNKLLSFQWRTDIDASSPSKPDTDKAVSEECLTFLEFKLKTPANVKKTLLYGVRRHELISLADELNRINGKLKELTLSNEA